MKKIFLLFLFTIISYQVNSQEASFSAGFDLLYSPEFSPEFKYYSQTFSLSYKHKVWNKFNLGLKLRYISSVGNFAWEKGDNPPIHNLDYNESKLFEYDEFKKGFYTQGRKARHWGINSKIIELYINRNFKLGKKFNLGISAGGQVLFYKESGLLLVVHNGELTTPEKDIIIVDTYLYQVFSSWALGINSELVLSYQLTESTALGVCTEFIIDSDVAYFPLEFIMSYKF